MDQSQPNAPTNTNGSNDMNNTPNPQTQSTQPQTEPQPQSMPTQAAETMPFQQQPATPVADTTPPAVASDTTAQSPQAQPAPVMDHQATHDAPHKNNNILLIVLVVAIVIVLAVAAYFAFSA